jgi:Flp pilus assembly protein TadG
VRANPRNLKVRSHPGQTLVELALLLPVLLLLTLGVIEMGRYFYIGILVGNAARAGAAYGSQSPLDSSDSSGIETAACNDFLNNFGSNPSPTCGASAGGTNSLAVTSSISCGCDNGGTVGYEANTGAMCTTADNTGLDTTCSNGNQGHWVVVVSVTASGTFNTLLNYPGIPSSITLSRTATLRVAN